MQSVAEKSSTLPKVIVFPARMASQAPIPPEQPTVPAPPVSAEATWWQRHGTTASWIALGLSALTVIGLFINIYLTLTARNEKTADEHLNNLIDARLNPATEKINSATVELRKQIADLNGDIKEIEGRLRGLEPLIQQMLAQRLKATKAISPKQLAKTAEQIAKSQGLPANPSGIKEATAKLIRTALDDPSAWNQAEAGLNYISLLNGNGPTLGELHQTNVPTRGYRRVLRSFTLLGGAYPGGTEKEADMYWVGQSSSVDDSARMELFGQPEPVSSGARFFVVNIKREYADSTAIYLDTLFLKNVIIRNSLVLYTGGALRLENVYFLNCKFVILPTPSGQRFAAALVSSPVSSLNIT